MAEKDDPRSLSAEELLAAYEIGGDHAEAGRTARQDHQEIWDLVIAHSRDEYVSSEFRALVESYHAGYRDCW